MRMLVLGAGLQGSACAYDLLRQPGVERVTIADLKPERIPAFLKPHVGKRLALLKLDVQEGAALRKARSEEHTSELQSRLHLVCRLLLEKKKKHNTRRVEVTSSSYNPLRTA